MADLFILDYQKNTVGILSNRMPFSLPFYEDVQERSLDDFTDTLSFKIPADHEQSEIVNADNYVLYPENTGKLKLYKIQELTEADSGENYKEVYAELSAQDDLIKDVVRPLSFKSASLEEVLTAILKDTEWSTGQIEDFGLLDYTISDYPTKLQALIDACTAYDAEFEFEYETLGTTVIGQKVNAYIQLGTETGKTFMIGKDLKGVERKEDRTQLVTALIGVGKETDGVPMTFEKETEAQLGTQLGGFPDGYEKPTGADYVGSLEALQKYSRTGKHIFGVYKDTEAQSSYELFKNAYEALKTYSKPIVTYQVDVVLLEKLTGYSHEEVEIGDTVLVQDKDIDLFLKARIRKMSRSISNPQEDTVELGDYIPITPTVNKQIAAVQDKISKNEEAWNKALEIDAVKDQIGSIPEALESKADKAEVDSKADKTELDAVKTELDTNYVTTTQLEQNAEDLNVKFSQGGGVNLVKNSVAYAGLDFWDNTYSTTGIYSIKNNTLDSLGFGSGFHFTPNGLDKGIQQDIYVEAGQTYTLSWYLNKLTSGADASHRFYVQIVENDSVKVQLEDNSATLTTDYEKYSLTYTATTNIITIKFGCYGSTEAMLTGVMLNVGDVPLQWGMAVGEVYNSNIIMNAKGIKVMSSMYDGYTAITPEEFAGYYNENGVEQKVFTLNKDITVIAKAEIQQEIRMSPIKVVPILSDTLNGWAFVIDEE